MKVSIFKQNSLKSTVFFLTLSALLLTALSFSSCSDSESLDISLDDTSLIAKIENATKTVVTAASLPAATQIALQEDLADSFIEKVQFASGLGYKVALITDDESKEELNSDVYFSKEGRQLEDRSEKAKKRRKQAFQFVFPLDFIMPDDSSITLESKDDWSLIKQWYKANTGATERPELVFPVEVVLEDNTVQTIQNREELEAIKEASKNGKDKRKCFHINLPYSLTMPDATIITVSKRADLKLVRAWHKANPNTTEKATLIFPVDIIYKDTTTATITNLDELLAAKEACGN